jgi:predicted nucleotidyltransferase
MTARVSYSAAALAETCRKHHVARLALFGSVLRDDFGPASDVDVLVDFVAGNVPGFLRLHVLEEDLSRVFGGRRVDVLTFQGLNPRIRDRVVATAEVQFAA